MKTLLLINERFQAKQRELMNLTMTDLCAVMGELGVTDRDHAAKKLALRELRQQGLID